MSIRSDLPPMGHIVLQDSPPSKARTLPSTCSTASKPKHTISQSSTDAPPSSRKRGSKRKTSSPPTPAIERKGCCL
nr:hypothetical protein CFP56_26356 [Quercus suber]